MWRVSAQQVGHARLRLLRNASWFKTGGAKIVARRARRQVRCMVVRSSQNRTTRPLPPPGACRSSLLRHRLIGTRKSRGLPLSLSRRIKTASPNSEQSASSLRRWSTCTCNCQPHLHPSDHDAGLNRRIRLDHQPSLVLASRNKASARLHAVIGPRDLTLAMNP